MSDDTTPSVNHEGVGSFGFTHARDAPVTYLPRYARGFSTRQQFTTRSSFENRMEVFAPPPPPPPLADCFLSLSLSGCRCLFWQRQLLQTTDSWKKKKKKQGGSAYMVNPVTNKNITLDQILAVEFLQQAFRRRVAQRCGGLLCLETSASLFEITVARQEICGIECDPVLVERVGIVRRIM